jgi:hypothetical protein
MIASPMAPPPSIPIFVFFKSIIPPSFYGIGYC